MEPLIEFDGDGISVTFCMARCKVLISLVDISWYLPGTDVESNSSFRILAATAINVAVNLGDEEMLLSNDLLGEIS